MHPLTNESAQVSASTSSAGSSNAAQIDLGSVSTEVDVFVDTSGAADLTVEVSTDGSTWREADTNSYGSDTTDFRQYDIAYQHVRAYLSANTTTVEVVGRGI